MFKLFTRIYSYIAYIIKNIPPKKLIREPNILFFIHIFPKRIIKDQSDAKLTKTLQQKNDREGYLRNIKYISNEALQKISETNDINYYILKYPSTKMY